jgi:hypothetical protein
MDVSQRRVAKRKKKQSPRPQQAQKKPLVRQPAPKLLKIYAEVLKDAVGFFLGRHSVSTVLDTKGRHFAQSKSH